MQRDPSKRPSPADVLQHPWLCEAAPDQPLEQVGACATIWLMWRPLPLRPLVVSNARRPCLHRCQRMVEQRCRLGWWLYVLQLRPCHESFLCLNTTHPLHLCRWWAALRCCMPRTRSTVQPW